MKINVFNLILRVLIIQSSTFPNTSCVLHYPPSHFTVSHNCQVVNTYQFFDILIYSLLQSIYFWEDLVFVGLVLKFSIPVVINTFYCIYSYRLQVNFILYIIIPFVIFVMTLLTYIQYCIKTRDTSGKMTNIHISGSEQKVLTKY